MLNFTYLIETMLRSIKFDGEIKGDFLKTLYFGNGKLKNWEPGNVNFKIAIER